jgi:hypothetical protein
MFDNTTLNVVIGLTFIYLLYSLLATILQEMVATNIGLRGKVLRHAIRRMLDDEINQDACKSSVSKAFYNHPLVKYLVADIIWPKHKIPSYLSKETFSKVMIDLLRGKDLQAGDAYNTVIANSLATKELAWEKGTIICAETSSYLNSLWIDAQGDVEKFRALLEEWFEEMMGRTTGWYKRWTQIILLGVGFSIALLFNVNTIGIANKLQHSPKMRAAIVNQAINYSKSHPAIENQTETERAVGDSLYSQSMRLIGQNGDITKANDVLSLGWKHKFLSAEDVGDWFWAIIGWIITALAISLGAPFWFDLLNKLVKLRSSTQIESRNPNADKNSGSIPAKKIAG